MLDKIGGFLIGLGVIGFIVVVLGYGFIS